MGWRLLPFSGVVLLAVIAAAGCSKRQPPPVTEAVTNAAETAASPVAPSRGPGPMTAPPRPAVIADSGNVDATLAALSLELRKYVVRTRSVPKNFEEFAAKSQAQVPPPPPGKKYAIKDQAVVLVKR